MDLTYLVRFSQKSDKPLSHGFHYVTSAKINEDKGFIPLWAELLSYQVALVKVYPYELGNRITPIQTFEIEWDLR